MCRITAILSKDKKTLQNIHAMTKALQHGGPDDEGFIINNELGYALGHRRLSIIDLSDNGHQPMTSINNNYEITYNGEIYNYKELRNELLKLGYSFKSNSDTEVILNAFDCWQEKMLTKFRGMFAFVIIDKINNIAFAARDFAGMKPLYIGNHLDGSIYFSSEVRGILSAVPQWQENENWKIWFLTYGFLPEPITTLQNVSPLPRASYTCINLNTLEQTTYSYKQYQYTQIKKDYKIATKNVKKLIEQSIERHLVSDVPVGIFLSGGIDSSILSIVAQQKVKSQIETVSIYFDDEKYSEKEFQEILIKQTGVKHHSYKITKVEFLNCWDDICKSFDQPSVDAINTYFICKYAKQNNLKVVLSGLGADEIFGGYPSIHRSKTYNTYQRLASLQFLIPKELIKSYPNKKIEFLKKRINASEYLLYRGLFTPSDVAKILNIEQQQVWQEISKMNFQEDISKFSNQERATYYETAIYMQSQLLKDSDIQSMWQGIELRVPYLDADLVEYVNNLHPSIKFINNNSKPKPLLVDAFIDVLPKEIWNRPKQGFTFPFENWFTTMSVFKNENLIPQWVYSLFTNRKVNFSRLWGVFLTNINKNKSTTLS